ncbi:ABC transporter permease [Myxococcus sp. K15C18031901]|uniref:ABC transporter permease n=1 Tax=Myxococcus dinghuensis TaxID=2906761 RepID=UPI0020A7AFF1|nr:ABC transporter permease [Myxococcus dinghuensis]MCP3100483.1 ABC transporter permease [Myxococcus dinghuensis]
MNALLQDFRLALRLLLRERVFTVMVVTTLALAVGATTAVFSIIYQVLLQPLPYPEPDQLVRVWQQEPGRDRTMVSWPALAAWRERTHTFSGLEGMGFADLTLTGEGTAERLHTARATAGLFNLLGVRPILGHAWETDAEVPGRDGVIVLSHELWLRRFGGDSALLGRALTLDGQPHTVVGVLPPGFQFAPGVEIWKPLARKPTEEHDNKVRILRVVGRMRPGLTYDKTLADLQRVSAELAQDFPGENFGVSVAPWHEQLVEGARTRLLLLAGVVALVLLVACANVANLLLARATTREREVSIRVALGANRWQLARQFLVESAVLAFAGAATGLMLALWGMKMMRTLVPEGLLPEQLRLEPHVLTIAAGLSLTTCFLSGLIPAIRAAHNDGRMALGGLRGGRGATGGRGALRAALVVAQVALSLVPLVGAGLMLRTLHALQAVPLGFQPQGVTVAEMFLSGATYQDDASRRRVLSELLTRVRALPGVDAAGLTSAVPLSGRNAFTPVVLWGESVDARSARTPVNFRAVSADYFASVGMSLRDGRAFGPEDVEGAPPVLIVNEAFAKRYFPGRSAVGQQVRLDFDEQPFREIVGVVGDIHHGSLTEAPATEVYMPVEQFLLPRMYLAVRARSGTAALAPGLREQLSAVDPALPLVQVRPLAEVVQQSYGWTEVMGSLFTALAMLGLTLAAVGLYGVLAYSVSQRTRELGIRVALGATDAQVVGLVMGQGMRLAGLGVVAGLVGAALFARSLGGMLYGVQTFDPVTFVTVPTLLGVVTLLASWVPVRRALRIPPDEALRAEG